MKRVSGSWHLTHFLVFYLAIEGFPCLTRVILFKFYELGERAWMSMSEVVFGLGVFCEAFEARLTFAWDVGDEVG